MKEARRFKEQLVKVIGAVLAEERTDSPVYSMVSGLLPPRKESAAASGRSATRGSRAERGGGRRGKGHDTPAVAAGGEGRDAMVASALTRAAAPPPSGEEEKKSARYWQEKALAAKVAGDFAAARDAWTELRKFNPNDSDYRCPVPLNVGLGERSPPAGRGRDEAAWASVCSP